jgi:hypothetical protein
MRTRTRTIKRTIMGAGALSLLMATPALAAPPSGPSGSIDLVQPPAAALSTLGETPPPALEVTYGDVADFKTVLAGKVSNKASDYVQVLCWQGDTYVYFMTHTGDPSFLMEEHDAQGIHWDGERADCEAFLIYRVDKGKSSKFTILDSEKFTVVPYAAPISA